MIWLAAVGLSILAAKQARMLYEICPTETWVDGFLAKLYIYLRQEYLEVPTYTLSINNNHCSGLSDDMHSMSKCEASIVRVSFKSLYHWRVKAFTDSAAVRRLLL